MDDEQPEAEAPATAEGPFTPDEALEAEGGDEGEKITGEVPVAAAHSGRLAVGVDVGGSGIKACAVDLASGELVGLRHRVPTPQPSEPAAVIASIRRMVRKIEKDVGLDPKAPVVVGFPAVVIEGV